MSEIHDICKSLDSIVERVEKAAKKDSASSEIAWYEGKGKRPEKPLHKAEGQCAECGAAMSNAGPLCAACNNKHGDKWGKYKSLKKSKVSKGLGGTAAGATAGGMMGGLGGAIIGAGLGNLGEDAVRANFPERHAAAKKSVKKSDVDTSLPKKQGNINNLGATNKSLQKGGKYLDENGNVQTRSHWTPDDVDYEAYKIDHPVDGVKYKPDFEPKKEVNKSLHKAQFSVRKAISGLIGFLTKSEVGTTPSVDAQPQGEKPLSAGVLLGLGLGSSVGNPMVGAALADGDAAELVEKCKAIYSEMGGNTDNLDYNMIGKAVVQAVKEMAKDGGNDYETMHRHGELAEHISNAMALKKNPALAAAGAGAVEGAAKPVGEGLGEGLKPLANTVGSTAGNLVEATPAVQGIKVGAANAAKVSQDAGNMMKFQQKNMRKSVAEPLGTKFQPQKREASFDGGGESEVSGDGTKANIKDLTTPNKTIKTG